MTDNGTIVVAQPKVKILIPSTPSSSHVTLRFNLTVLQGCTVTLLALDPYSGENISSKVTAVPPAIQVSTLRVFVPLFRPVDFAIETSSGVYDVTTILTKPVMKFDLTSLLAEKFANQCILSATGIFETVKASGSTVGAAEYERKSLPSSCRFLSSRGCGGWCVSDAPSPPFSNRL